MHVQGTAAISLEKALQDLADLQRSSATDAGVAKESMGDLQDRLAQAFASLEAATEEKDAAIESSGRTEQVLADQLQTLKDQLQLAAPAAHKQEQVIQGLQLKLHSAGIPLPT